MVEKDNGTLRAVAWSEVCPWFNIFRTFRLAISVRVLVLGAVAVLLTAMVWGALGRMFSVRSEGSGEGDSAVTVYSDATAWTKPYAECPWKTVTGLVPDEPALPGVPKSAKAEASPPKSAQEYLPLPSAADWTANVPFVGVWAQLTRPLWELFVNRDATVKDLACLLLCGLGSLAIWAFFGAAITRIAAVQLAAEERVGWAAALRFACSKWASFFAAPLFPIGGMALAAVPIWLLGWLLRTDPGLFVVALCWPLLFIFALVMVLLLLGLLFGWPLMWATISAEGTDSFDALSRCYAYVFQRPLHYLFYVAVAWVFGLLGWLLVKNFAAGVVWLTYWSAGWSAGWDAAGEMPRIDAIVAGSQSLGGLGQAGAVIIHFWAGCVKLLAVGFLYGYFWTASTAIYFLLRRDVDATEMDEVFLEADESEQAPLPPVMTDAAGAPTVADGERAPADEGTAEPLSPPAPEP